MKNRTLRERLVQKADGKYSRLVVLTGARQTGKTTLVRQTFPDVPYLSFEDPVVRPTYSRLSAAEWVEKYPTAILDEVQKSPAVIESVKAAHDSAAHVRYFLLGSSQILLLSKVRESLAGRAALEELWPLTLPEIATSSWDEPVQDSRFVRWLKGDLGDHQPLLDSPLESPGFARMEADFERYLRFGGMPVVHDPELSDSEREEWLANYQRTYLERDVTDLAAMRDLEPFVLAQRALAARTGRLVNFSDLARNAAIAVPTARRFLRYLELSYQVVVLHPYYRNPEKRLARMPKIHFVDPGVLRSITRRSGTPTGEEFESAVVAEVFKQVRNAALKVDFHHLRTYDGREVDLLLELEQGFVAIEVKMTEHVHPTDARAVRGLGSFLDKPLLKSVILSQDRDARLLEEGVLGVPAAWALSAPSPPT
jgi:predicted AAA+ superfamily ATPase